MKRYGHMLLRSGLLVMALALLATGCALDGASGYTETYVGYGFYGGYGMGYYDHDVIVTPPPASRPPDVRPSPPPRPTHLPARPLPRPAPRRR